MLCVPEMDKDRYYSVMLTSQYTFNFGYIGSRATGNDAGCYAVAGPGWTGDTPKGVEKVFTSETEFALATYRTQLFNAANIDNVKAIQAKYEVEPLSAFLGEPAPTPAPEVDWPKTNATTEKKDVLRTSRSSSSLHRRPDRLPWKFRSARHSPDRHRGRQAIPNGGPDRCRKAALAGATKQRTRR